MNIPLESKRAICESCGRKVACSHPCNDECGIIQHVYKLCQPDPEEYQGKHAKPETAEDVVNNPQHYQHGTFEVIDEMLIAFGPEKTFTFCILNAWKYRSRAPYKGKHEEDMDKADRYMQMARSIAAKNPDAFPVYTHLIKNEDDS